MTSLYGGIHTISTNRKESNIHPLKWRVNKTQLPNHHLLPLLLLFHRVVLQLLEVVPYKSWSSEASFPHWRGRFRSVDEVCFGRAGSIRFHYLFFFFFSWFPSLVSFV
ncbi:hypothetical protein RHMOL_Rhmol08G0168800 [Rhododendron molle]|uniref:Uncharacterized protein n=1 Tax=Rhododendron molle TaxID=49168 RepID=A0ACC0MPK0_RHOML|nr:hypothetical protein RHMOL_Rhmol08G0168800 [Rhododendron molle]